MVIYRSKNGVLYEQLKQLGNGGEGNVYALKAPHDDKVLKVYHPHKRPSDPEQIAKLTALSSFRPKNPDFFKQVAWIRDIIYDKSEICAIVLQKAIGKELSLIVDNKNLDWNKRLTIAKNFCGLVFHLHSENQVIGDFNDNNFLVDTNSQSLKMVDIDSIHFKDGTGKIYRCGVCMPDIAAPELIGIPVNSSPLPTFTTQTDLWALAIHIFRLLMYDYHPFSAAVVAKTIPFEVFSLNQRVKNGQTPFFKKEQALTIPKEAAEVNWVFPTTTIELFKQTFIDGHSNPSKRVGAKEWFEELNMLSRNTVTCSLNPSHVYYRGKNVCPWCEVERKIVKNTFSNIKTMGSQPTSTSVLSKPKIQTNQPLKSVTPTISTAPTKSNPLQYRPSELFNTYNLKKWLITSGIISTIFGAGYSLVTTGGISLENLVNYSIRFFFPYLLIGSVRWGRDYIIQIREGARTFLINIGFVSAVIIMRISETISNNGVTTFDFYWDTVALIFLAWFLGTGISRILTLSISKIPNYPNSDTTLTIIDTIALVSMIIGTLAAGTDYMVASTGKENWGNYYIETLPQWLKFLEDLFSIKIFSIEQSSIFFTLGILATLILIFIPELSSKLPKNLKFSLSLGGIILGYLLTSSYFAAVLSIGYVIITMVIVILFMWFVISIFAE